MENVSARMENVRMPNIRMKGKERQSESAETGEKEKSTMCSIGSPFLVI